MNAVPHRNREASKMINSINFLIWPGVFPHFKNRSVLLAVPYQYRNHFPCRTAHCKQLAILYQLVIREFDITLQIPGILTACIALCAFRQLYDDFPVSRKFLFIAMKLM